MLAIIIAGMVSCSAVDCLNGPDHYYFPPGHYAFEEPVIWGSDALDRYTLIEGAGPRATTLHFTGEEFAFILNRAGGVTFKNLSVFLGPDAQGAFQLIDANYNKLENVIVDGSPYTGTGIALETVNSTSSHNAFERIFLSNLGLGIKLNGNANSNLFEDITFQGGVQQAIDLNSSTNTFVHLEILYGNPAVHIGSQARSNSFFNVTFDGPTLGLYAEQGNNSNVFVGLTLTTKPAGPGVSALTFVASSHTGKSNQADYDVQPQGTQLGSVTMDQLKDQPVGTMVYCSNCRRSTSCDRPGLGSIAFKTYRGWQCTL